MLIKIILKVEKKTFPIDSKVNQFFPKINQKKSQMRWKTVNHSIILSLKAFNSIFLSFTLKRQQSILRRLESLAVFFLRNLKLLKCPDRVNQLQKWIALQKNRLEKRYYGKRITDQLIVHKNCLPIYNSIPFHK